MKDNNQNDSLNHKPMQISNEASNPLTETEITKCTKRRIVFSNDLNNNEMKESIPIIIDKGDNCESKEGETLLKNIQSNLYDIRTNIDQVYDNMNNPQLSQASTTLYSASHYDTNNRELAKLKARITNLEAENNRLNMLNEQLLKKLKVVEKTEVIRYQKKYLAEMKELEAYFTSIIMKYTKELEKANKDKEELVKWKEENCAYTDDLLQKNLELRKEVAESTEVYQNNINILKLKMTKLQYKYNNIQKCGYNSHLLNSLTVSNTKQKEDIKGHTFTNNNNDIWSDGFDFQNTKINSDWILSDNGSLNQENLDILRLCSERYALEDNGI